MKKDIIILPEDRRWLHSRISELEKEILDLGPDFHDVFNQSSETWHDNAPFEALRDKQSVLFAELQGLKKVRMTGSLPIPKPKKDMVSIGSRVTVGDRVILIAGDWSYRSGTHYQGNLVVSCNTPLAQELIGKKLRANTRFGTITGIQ